MAPFEADPERIDFDLLATYLKALASPVRLELLWKLRQPTAAGDVELRPRRPDDLGADRSVSRQTIAVHLEKLEEAGVASRVPGPEGNAGRWVANVPHLFALIEEMRKIARIPPSEHLDLDATVPRAPAEQTPWEPGRKLVVLTGPWEGRVFPLEGAGPWSLGRSRAAHVALTFDPYVSSEHAEVRLAPEGHAIAVHAKARNPASLNHGPIPPGASRLLRHGDAVGLGRTTLLFRER